MMQDKFAHKEKVHNCCGLRHLLWELQEQITNLSWFSDSRIEKLSRSYCLCEENPFTPLQQQQKGPGEKMLSKYSSNHTFGLLSPPFIQKKLIFPQNHFSADTYISLREGKVTSPLLFLFIVFQIFSLLPNHLLNLLHFKQLSNEEKKIHIFG